MLGHSAEDSLIGLGWVERLTPPFMKKLFIASLLLLAACTHLQTDSSVSAIGAGYHTAEFRVKDEIYHGLGIVSVIQGSSLADIGLKVQGYYSGTIRVDSEDCQIHSSASYSNFDLIPIALTGVADKSCIVSVVVSPVYPAQNHSPVEVFGFQGHFGIKVLKAGEDWVGSTEKVTGHFSKELNFNVGGDGLVRGVFTGCGIDFDKALPLENGILKLNLSDLVKFDPVSTCVIEGVIISPIYKDLLVSIVVAQYSSNFVPLPLPVITMTPGKVAVTGDATVSVVGLDQAHYFSTHRTFNLADTTGPHLIRILTVKGRSVLCSLKKGEWQCLQ